jgi:gas vesicle protein
MWTAFCVGLGFGVGACLVFCLAALLLAPKRTEQKQFNEELFDYWRQSIEKHAEQIDHLKAISESLREQRK